MKKILQINTVVNSGATGRAAEDIGQIAKSIGWDSYIAYGRNTRTSNSKLIKIGSGWNTKLHVLQTRLFDRHGFGSVNPTKKLIDKIDKLKPDIIHLLNLHGYFINIDILFNYLRKSRIPVIWTLFDCWAFTGHYTYFDIAGCNKWQTNCFKCPSKADYPSSWVVDNSKLNYFKKRELFTSLPNLTLIVHSEWLKKLVQQSFLKELPLTRIPNRINITNFSYSPKRDFIYRNKLSNFKIILGIANSWIKRKGLEDFIKLSKLIDSDTRILLIGLSRNQVRNLPQNVIAVKRTESIKELTELYSSADVFINPTFEDNFPTTNLEALACGIPVITYNTGGSPETIDSETGIVVEKSDIQGLADAVKKIILNGKNFYSLACVERSQQLFDDSNEYYLNLFKSFENKRI